MSSIHILWTQLCGMSLLDWGFRKSVEGSNPIWGFWSHGRNDWDDWATPISGIPDFAKIVYNTYLMKARCYIDTSWYLMNISRYLIVKMIVGGNGWDGRNFIQFCVDTQIRNSFIFLGSAIFSSSDDMCKHEMTQLETCVASLIVCFWAIPKCGKGVVSHMELCQAVELRNHPLLGVVKGTGF